MTSKCFLPAVAVLLVLAAGIVLRAHSTVGCTQVGYDEHMYSNYVREVAALGPGQYRRVVATYEAWQETSDEVIVHPLRMFYILTAYFWMKVFHMDALAALHAVAAAFGVLYLLVSGVFAWRTCGQRATTLGILSLVAFAPLQIWISQRALVDGVFAFWATACFWLLWENMRNPTRAGWLVAYALALCLMTLTKEYALFPFIGLCGLTIANRWLGFGVVTPKLLIATLAGPAVAVLILVHYAGGVVSFAHLYLMVVRKSQVLDYAIKCQEGPWSRYMLDFLLISPPVLLLAVGRLFQLKREDRIDFYCALFLICCYVPMANVSGGMSLRFAAFWDLPLCWLAFSEINVIVARFPAARKPFLLGVLTFLVCCAGLYQYYWLFVEKSVYEPITRNMLHAVDILKK